MNDAPARVLDALRRAGDEPCSGASLSSDLGVSRAQVWKHVEGLRARGLWVPAIRPPTVPEGTARLRIALSAAHTEADVQRLLQALAELRPAHT